MKIKAGDSNAYFKIRNDNYRNNGGDYVQYYKISKGYIEVDDYTCIAQAGRNTIIQRLKWILDKTELVQIEMAKKDYCYMDFYRLEIDKDVPDIKLSKYIMLDEGDFFVVDDAVKYVEHKGPNDKDRYHNATRASKYRILIRKEFIPRYENDDI